MRLISWTLRSGSEHFTLPHPPYNGQAGILFPTFFLTPQNIYLKKRGGLGVGLQFFELNSSSRNKETMQNIQYFTNFASFMKQRTHAKFCFMQFRKTEEHAQFCFILFWEKEKMPILFCVISRNRDMQGSGWRFLLTKIFFSKMWQNAKEAIALSNFGCFTEHKA